MNKIDKVVCGFAYTFFVAMIAFYLGGMSINKYAVAYANSFWVNPSKTEYYREKAQKRFEELAEAFKK